MKIAELKGKSSEELKSLITDMKKEQLNLRFQRAQGEQAAQGRFREVRRTIARAKTLIHQQKKA